MASLRVDAIDLLKIDVEGAELVSNVEGVNTAAFKVSRTGGRKFFIRGTIYCCVSFEYQFVAGRCCLDVSQRKQSKPEVTETTI